MRNRCPACKILPGEGQSEDSEFSWTSGLCFSFTIYIQKRQPSLCRFLNVVSVKLKAFFWSEHLGDRRDSLGAGNTLELSEVLPVLYLLTVQLVHASLTSGNPQREANFRPCFSSDFQLGLEAISVLFPPDIWMFFPSPLSNLGLKDKFPVRTC